MKITILIFSFLLACGIVYFWDKPYINYLENRNARVEKELKNCDSIQREQAIPIHKKRIYGTITGKN